MPIYQKLIICLPKYPHDKLALMVKRHAKAILNHGGIVRGVENHGVRALQERAKRKYATSEGDRYFWEARMISVTFDASPICLKEAERALRNEDSVLRWHVSKETGNFDKINSRSYKNPYAPNPKI